MAKIQEFSNLEKFKSINIIIQLLIQTNNFIIIIIILRMIEQL